MFDNLGRKFLEAGEVLFRVGDVGDSAYLVEEGEMEVIHPESHSVLGVVHVGELFGEVSLLDKHPRTATVRARSDSSLIEIRRELVEELLQAADPVIRFLLQVVLERYRSNILYRATHDAAQPPARDPLHTEVAEKLVLLKDLHEAIEQQQFELNYQPIFGMSSQSISGFEALIRWRHPQRGLILPSRFLSLAEDTGMIQLIGQWCIEQACRDWPSLRSVANTENPFLSVNVSGKQLRDPQFAAEVIDIQRRFDMPPEEFKFELTETSLIANHALASVLLRELKDYGNLIALDDYGTGFSNMEHLMHFPFNVLKLDQSFVREIMNSSLSFQLVMNSIDMAKSLHMKIVGEGIECPEVAYALAEMGCDYAQGYLYSKPLSLRDCLALKFPVSLASK